MQHQMGKRIGVIILAAGLSSRMGDFKILLPWIDNKPILTHVVSKYIALNINPIIIVTGRDAERVQETVAGLPVKCVHNPNYATGEILSSVKIGLQAMPDDVVATFINPADMPRIPQSIIETMQASCQPQQIIAPRYQGQRGHPILLDKTFWQAMINLPTDGAPRDVIKANRQYVHFIDTEDDGVIIDIDTPETYQRELKHLDNSFDE
jgi:molybdenum cofactor cytidylyltransferase